MLLSVMMVYKYWDSITVSHFTPRTLKYVDIGLSVKISNSPSGPKLQFGKSRIHSSLVLVAQNMKRIRQVITMVVRQQVSLVVSVDSNYTRRVATPPELIRHLLAMDTDPPCGTGATLLSRLDILYRIDSYTLVHILDAITNATLFFSM